MSGTRDELDEGDFLTKVRRLSGKLPMLRDVLAAYACMVDANTPAWAKATIACALAYFVCPLDAIPDWLFPVGYTDDAAVLTGALVAVEPYLHAAHYRGLDDSDWRALDVDGFRRPPGDDERAAHGRAPSCAVDSLGSARRMPSQAPHELGAWHAPVLPRRRHEAS